MVIDSIEKEKLYRDKENSYSSLSTVKKRNSISSNNSGATSNFNKN